MGESHQHKKYAGQLIVSEIIGLYYFFCRNEDKVGEAILLQSGIPRDEIFVITKVPSICIASCMLLFNYLFLSSMVFDLSSVSEENVTSLLI